MLVLTYAGGKDGFGAQYQRVLGIYSIAKEFDIPYFHTEILTIDYQGLDKLMNNTNDDEFIRIMNRRAQLPSDISKEELNNFEERKGVLTIPILRELLRDSAKENARILYKVTLPYGIIDRTPHLYQHVSGIYNTIIPKNDIFTIGIHVRRGDLFLVESRRMLPNSYYTKLCKYIEKVLQDLNLKFRFELYTEIPKEDMDITVNNENIVKHITSVEPKRKGEEVSMKLTKSQVQIEDFDILPNLHKFINEDLEKTFDRMINCDILVTSRSSLSAVASYLKSDGISIYHPFWHSMLPTDLSVGDKNFQHKFCYYMNSYCIKNRIGLS